MIETNKEVGYLLHLISCALNEKKPLPASDELDFSVLFRLAKKHQLYSMIFPLIMDMENVPESEKNNWKNYHFTELAKLVTVESEREILYKELTDNKIKYMPLKGLILKNYYPDETMRQMSDNDILIESPDKNLIFEIMKRHGYKIYSTSENSDDFMKPPFSAFEFHRTLFFEGNDFCPRFDNVWENGTSDKDNEFEYSMNLNDVYLHSVCHMYKHFSTAGCGIRFLADIYVFLKKENDNLDWNYINDYLEKHGILQYEKESKSLADKIFNEKELSDDEMKLLETYINFGIYGKGDVRISREVEKLAEKGETSIGKAKRKYIFSRLFPSKKKMKEDYIALQKRPYLLPLYYIFRLFKGIFNGRRTINEYKTINNVNEK